MENCVICGTRFLWEFTIFHGQGACTTCGALYALKGFEDRTETVSDISEKGIELLKEYWNATKQYLGLGMFMPTKPSIKVQKDALDRWIAKNHPEIKPD